MNVKPLLVALLTLSVSTMVATAQSAPKVAVINLLQALSQTKEGVKASGELQAKVQPRQKELEQRQNEMNQKQQLLNASSNTMSEEARGKLTREIDTLRKGLERDVEDYRAQLEAEQNKVVNDLLPKLDVVIKRYAKDNNIGIVLDATQQSNIYWFSDALDITADVIALYDRAAGAAPTPTSQTPPAPAPKRAAPAPPAKP